MHRARGIYELLTGCLLASAALAAPALADDAPPRDPLYVILYKQGPAWKEGVPMKQQDAIGAHYKYMKQGFEAGTILDAGATLDEPGGVVIFRAADLDAAKAFMAADPSVSLKMFTGEIHSWAPTFFATPPDRAVQGRTLISGGDPQMQLDLPASATYAGMDHWLLKQYFDQVELHAFVEAAPDKRVQKLYWLQFEAYLPSHLEYHHTYDSNRHVNIGGLDFLVDTWAESESAKDEPDSDTAHLKAVLAAKGYALPASMISVRFVHLMDGARKELMFIYSEPVPDGLTAADLKQDGKAYAQWPAIEKGFIERGEKSIQFH
jgi:uncharacterized protein YciI